MRRSIGVLVVLLSTVILAESLAAQGATRGGTAGAQESDFELGQNYPNPFNPETKIPFALEEDLFAEGQSVVVTLRIFNVLQQFVANPTALNHPLGEGTPVEGLEFGAPGRYEAYWDGLGPSGSPVASGVYFVQLVVNGRSQVRKMFVTK